MLIDITNKTKTSKNGFNFNLMTLEIQYISRVFLMKLSKIISVVSNSEVPLRDTVRRKLFSYRRTNIIFSASMFNG